MKSVLIIYASKAQVIVNINALILLATCSVGIFLLNRKYAILCFIIGILYIPQTQSIYFLNINLFPIRILEVIGFLRVVCRKELVLSGKNKIDFCFTLLFSYMLCMYLLFSEKILFYQLAPSVDALLCYYTFKGLIKNLHDVCYILYSTIFLMIPFTGMLAVESLTAKNPFYLLGAEEYSVMFREGYPRCIGSFRHPSLLGSFGASILPMYIGYYFYGQQKKMTLLGIALCIVIVLLSNSGGPYTAIAICILGWSCWYLKKRMKLITACFVIMIILVGFYMKAPIWYLLERISIFSGGDGWHRSYLIDIAFKNLDKWWFSGMDLEQTSEWFPYTIYTGAADIINQYIYYGLTAGLGATILFIILIILCFNYVMINVSFVRHSRGSRPGEDKFLWGFGVMLLVHSFNLIGITYFDQMYMVWYMHIAIIASLCQNFTSSHNIVIERKRIAIN
ncbi:MAG TPA: hypothetical protein VLH16_01865 [Bacteroidales bacterium]|nr:hypothetical protein [Bacteroidales bacterium]